MRRITTDIRTYFIIGFFLLYTFYIVAFLFGWGN